MCVVCSPFGTPETSPIEDQKTMLRHLQQLGRKAASNGKCPKPQGSPLCPMKTVASRAIQQLQQDNYDSRRGSSNSERQRGLSIGISDRCLRKLESCGTGTKLSTLDINKSRSNHLAVGTGCSPAVAHRNGPMTGSKAHALNVVPRGDDWQQQHDHCQSMDNLMVHPETQIRSNTMSSCMHKLSSSRSHLVPRVNVVGGRGESVHHHHTPQHNACELLARQAAYSSSKGNVVYCELYTGNNNEYNVNGSRKSGRSGISVQAVRALFAHRKSGGGGDGARASISNGARLLQHVGLNLNRSRLTLNTQTVAAESGGRSERDIKRGRRIVRQVCVSHNFGLIVEHELFSL